MAMRRHLLQAQRDAVLADLGGEEVEAAKEELLGMLAEPLALALPYLVPGGRVRVRSTPAE